VDADWSRLDSFVLEKMSKTRLPSVVVRVVDRAGLPRYSKAFGFRDIERGLPATEGTVYGVGSVTKSFTALSIAMLAEDGRLSIEDPVERYVPEFRLKPMGEEVKIIHLLTHSSGIPALAYAEAFIRGALGLDSSWLPLATPSDVLSFMSEAGEWAAARPGERFFYLNEGYVVLGLIVSRVSGVPYEEFVRRRILEPLEMRRSYFSEEEVSKDPDVAAPYIVDREGRHVRSRFPYGITADGGLLSNAVDMSNYLAMYLNRGVFKGVQLIDEEWIEEVEKPRVDYPFKLFGDESYALGWFVTEGFYGRKLVYHSGSVLVYTAFAAYMPGDGLGVVVLSNASGYPLSLIGLYALSLALGYDPEKTLEPIRRDRILDKLVGTYETYKGTYRVQVERAGDFLKIVYRDRYTESATVLIPEEIEEDFAKFYTYSYGRRITAEFYERNGRIEMMYERYRFMKRG